jgi:hypothetical protein
MNSVLAIIADGGRAIVVIHREAVEINYVLLYLLILLKPFNGGLDKPIPQRTLGVWYDLPIKPCRWRGIRLHHGGDVCVLMFS